MPLYTAEQIATRIVEMDRYTFANIPPQEIIAIVNHTKDPKPHFAHFLASSEYIGNWMREFIVEGVSIRARSERIAFWIEVMENCYKNHDHFAFFALKSALHAITHELVLSYRLTRKKARQVNERLSLVTQEQLYDATLSYSSNTIIVPMTGLYTKNFIAQKEHQALSNNKDISVSVSERMKKLRDTFIHLHSRIRDEEISHSRNANALQYYLTNNHVNSNIEAFVVKARLLEPRELKHQVTKDLDFFTTYINKLAGYMQYLSAQDGQIDRQHIQFIREVMTLFSLAKADYVDTLAYVVLQKQQQLNVSRLDIFLSLRNKLIALGNEFQSVIVKQQIKQIINALGSHLDCDIHKYKLLPIGIPIMPIGSNDTNLSQPMLFDIPADQSAFIDNSNTSQRVDAPIALPSYDNKDGLFTKKPGKDGMLCQIDALMQKIVASLYKEKIARDVSLSKRADDIFKILQRGDKQALREWHATNNKAVHSDDLSALFEDLFKLLSMKNVVQSRTLIMNSFEKAIAVQTVNKIRIMP